MHAKCNRNWNWNCDDVFGDRLTIELTMSNKLLLCKIVIVPNFNKPINGKW